MGADVTRNAIIGVFGTILWIILLVRIGNFLKNKYTNQKYFWKRSGLPFFSFDSPGEPVHEPTSTSEIPSGPIFPGGPTTTDFPWPTYSTFVPGSVNPLEAGLSCPNFFNPPSIFSRIVNGQEAVKGNWPWFAWFGGCGGTILTKKTDGSDDLIMTGKGGMNSRESLSPQFPFKAAHCCGYFSSVRIGMHQKMSQNADEYFSVPILAYRMHQSCKFAELSSEF